MENEVINSKEQRKLEKRRLFEERQYIRLQAIKSKGRYAGYLAVLIGVILLVDLLDNFVTSVNSNVTSCYINEFFVNGHLFGIERYEDGLFKNIAGEKMQNIFANAVEYFKK